MPLRNAPENPTNPRSVESPDSTVSALRQDTHNRVERTGRWITKSKKGLVATYLGPLLSWPTEILLGLKGDILSSTDTRKVEQTIQENFANVPLKGDVLVRIGHNNVFGELYRLFKPGIKNRPNILLRMALGVPATIMTALTSSLTRADHYNPFTRSMVVYHSSNLGIAAHEAGHAIDFDNKKFPGLHALFHGIWPITLMHEYDASKIAMQHLNSPQRSEAVKVLEPAFGTYVGGVLGAIGGAFNPSRWLAAGLSLGPILAGHIHSRFNKRKRGDYNIFFNADEDNNYSGASLESMAYA